MYGIRERIAITAMTDAAINSQIRNSTVEVAVMRFDRARTSGVCSLENNGLKFQL